MVGLSSILSGILSLKSTSGPPRFNTVVDGVKLNRTPVAFNQTVRSLSVCDLPVAY